MRVRRPLSFGLSRTLVRMLAIPVALLAVTTCSGDGGPPSGPAEPDAGRMEVRVSAAPSGTGILLVEVTGRRTGPITAVGQGELWASDESSTRAVFLIRGSTVPGPVASFPSPDRGGAYTVRVLEAAAGASQEYAVLDVADFTVTVSPVN